MSDDKSLQEKSSAAISTRDVLVSRFYQKPRTLHILDYLAIINNEIKDANHSITRRFEKTRSEEQVNQYLAVLVVFYVVLSWVQSFVFQNQIILTVQHRTDRRPHQH